MQLFICFFAFIFLSSATANQRVRLRDVQVLTFTQGHMTNSRRFAPEPQLILTKGNSLYAPLSVICDNVGFDGQNVNWRCSAPNMKYGYDLGNTVVSCEGYSYPDDPYVVVGSCSLLYELVGPHLQNPYVQHTMTNQKQDSLVELFLVVLFLLFSIWFVTLIMRASSRKTTKNVPTNNDVREKEQVPPNDVDLQYVEETTPVAPTFTVVTSHQSVVVNDTTNNDTHEKKDEQ